MICSDRLHVSHMLEIQCCHQMVCSTCFPRWLQMEQQQQQHSSPIRCFNCRAEVTAFRVPWNMYYTRLEPRPNEQAQCNVRWPKLIWLPDPDANYAWQPLASFL
jgi:hypothetical protein